MNMYQSGFLETKVKVEISFLCRCLLTCSVLEFCSEAKSPILPQNLLCKSTPVSRQGRSGRTLFRRKETGKLFCQVCDRKFRQKSVCCFQITIAVTLITPFQWQCKALSSSFPQQQLSTILPIPNPSSIRSNTSFEKHVALGDGWPEEAVWPPLLGQLY